MLIRVIDFETTGMPDDEGGAAICEVGWCDVRVESCEPGAVPIAYVDRDSFGFQLCNPGRLIPPAAMAIHHIRNADVANMPPPSEVLAQMVASGADAFAAHNADFERSFFDPQTPWVCTYKVALRIWPDLSQHNNQFLRYALPLILADETLSLPAHRAGPDAWVTAHLLVSAIQSARASIDDMIRWSNGPALLPRINFGKHKGAKWQDVPTDYLIWIIDRSDMDRDVKANARYWIKVRAQEHAEAVD